MINVAPIGRDGQITFRWAERTLFFIDNLSHYGPMVWWRVSFDGYFYVKCGLPRMAIPVGRLLIVRHYRR